MKINTQNENNEKNKHNKNQNSKNKKDEKPQPLKQDNSKQAGFDKGIWGNWFEGKKHKWRQEKGQQNLSKINKTMMLSQKELMKEK